MNAHKHVFMVPSPSVTWMLVSVRVIVCVGVDTNFRFGDKYPSLRATVLKKLFEAIGEEKALTTAYGGLVGLTMFGPKPVDAFILPQATAHWQRWSRKLEQTTDLTERFEICQCQHALLEALAVYLRKSSDDVKGEQVQMEELEDCFGDRLIPLHDKCNDYRLSFI